MDVFVSGGKVDYSCRGFRGEAAFGQVVQHSGNGFEVTVDFFEIVRRRRSGLFNLGIE